MSPFGRVWSVLARMGQNLSAFGHFGQLGTPSDVRNDNCPIPTPKTGVSPINLLILTIKVGEIAHFGVLV